MLRISAFITAFVFLASTHAAPEPPADQALVPCLAVGAGGSPVCPAASFPSSKRVTVAFQLPADATAKKLDSRWFFLGDEKLVAENSLDLEGKKTGWLRLELQQPAPPGKYRLDTLLDGKPWKSVEVTITDPIAPAKDVKPADFIPLTEGTVRTYNLVEYPVDGKPPAMAGVTPDAHGAIRATLGLSYGKTDELGTLRSITINDKPMGETWVKLDDKGVWLQRKKIGDKTEEVKPPHLIMSLPPALADLTEWSITTPDGDEEKYTLFGPMMLEGPDGPAAGYLMFSDGRPNFAAGGTAMRGHETTQRYFIPKVGLVRELRHSTLNGKARSRHELSMILTKPYRIAANPELKGRLGRVAFEYPRETNYSGARTAIFKADAKPDTKPQASGYGDTGFDMMPGRYSVAINNKRVPVEVKSGHNTVPLCGVLRVHAGAQTRFRVLDSDKQTELCSGYGEADVPLPVGTYFLEITGVTEEIKITDGQITEF